MQLGLFIGNNYGNQYGNDYGNTLHKLGQRDLTPMTMVFYPLFLSETAIPK